MTGLDWLPCDLERMTGPEWLRIPAVLRGHWHALWCWCGSRRNGGRIEDCRSFTNRDWDRIAGVTKAALRKLVEAGLVSWDGDDLIVSFYPVDAESKARSRSRAAKSAAERRWSSSAGGAEKTDANAAGSQVGGDASRIAKGNAGGSAFGNAEERRGREREEQDPAPPAVGDLFPGESGKKKRRGTKARRKTPDPALGAKTRALCIAAAEAFTGAGRRTDANGEKLHELCEALAKAGRTPDQVRAVVRVKASEWAGDDRMARYVKPSVILGRGNFAKYLEEDVPTTRAPAAASEGAKVIVPPTGERRGGWQV